MFIGLVLDYLYFPPFTYPVGYDFVAFYSITPTLVTVLMFWPFYAIGVLWLAYKWKPYHFEPERGT